MKCKYPPPKARIGRLFGRARSGRESLREWEICLNGEEILERVLAIGIHMDELMADDVLWILGEHMGSQRGRDCYHIS